MKVIVWLGNTHEVVKNYSSEIKQDIGYNLDLIQRGLLPRHWKPIMAVGHGVKEIIIHEKNEYRVLYVSKFEESIYVLHAFIKKSQQTLKRDIDLARQRYIAMLDIRRTTK